jgi:hypothetical protein
MVSVSSAKGDDLPEKSGFLSVKCGHLLAKAGFLLVRAFFTNKRLFIASVNVVNSPAKSSSLLAISKSLSVERI